MSEHSASEIPPELSERFEVHESLPDGTTGRRFMATERVTGRRGILELIFPAVIGSASDRQRLKRELAKQSTLTHPHLALPWVTGELQKTLWLFREWVGGQSLRQRLDDVGSLSVSETLAITTQIAAGLDELHRAGLLFRDLTPEHVILRDDGAVVLVGAGLAPRIDHDDVFELYGTAAYLSPEQCKGKLVSFRSDLYALGCVAYEMATGQPPFSGESAQELIAAHRDQDPPPAPDGFPDEARALLEALLAKDPRKRPFSAQQVRRSLDPFVPEDLKSGDEAPPQRRAQRTLVGMPAVGSSPPKPPSMSRPPRPPSMNPPKAASKKSPDATQQVRLDDILDEKPIAASTPPPAPARASAPPAPPSSASTPPPAPARASAPPAPPSSASTPPPAPARASAPPVSVSSPPNPDATQQLEPVDILEEKVVAPTSQPPAATPAVNTATSQSPVAADAAASAETAGLPPVEEFTAAAEAALAQAPAAAPGEGAAVDGLDYEDDAPTIARDSLSGIAPMAPSVSAESAPTDPGQSAAPAASGPQQYPAAAASAAPASVPPASQPPASQPPAAGYPSVAPAAPAPDNRNGLYMLGAAALIFLSVVAFIGYQLLRDDDEPVAAATPPVATSAAPALAPAQVPPPVVPSTPAAPTPPKEDPTPAEAPGDVAEAAEEPTAEVSEEAPAEEAAEAQEEAAEAQEEAAEAQEEAAEEPETTVAATTSMRSSMRASMRASNMRSSMRASGSAFDDLREQARAHFQARRFREAAQAYERATAINPRHAGSWAGLGAARMALRDYRGAAEAYQRAVALNPRSSGFFTSLGHAYRLGGNRNGARAAYQRALALNPNNRSAQQWLQQL